MNVRIHKGGKLILGYLSQGWIVAVFSSICAPPSGPLLFLHFLRLLAIPHNIYLLASFIANNLFFSRNMPKISNYFVAIIPCFNSPFAILSQNSPFFFFPSIAALIGANWHIKEGTYTTSRFYQLALLDMNFQVILFVVVNTAYNTANYARLLRSTLYTFPSRKLCRCHKNNNKLRISADDFGIGRDGKA